MQDGTYKLNNSLTLEVGGDKNVGQNIQTKQDKLLQYNVVL